MRRAAALAAMCVWGAVALAAAPAAPAAVRESWVAAVPVTWNMVPNGRDAITGMQYATAQTVFPTTVYRRYTRGWKHPLFNAPLGSGNQDLIPGPLLRGRDPLSVLQDLAAVRNPLYALAHLRIPSAHAPHEVTVTAILKALGR